MTTATKTRTAKTEASKITELNTGTGRQAVKTKRAVAKETPIRTVDTKVNINSRSQKDTDTKLQAIDNQSPTGKNTESSVFNCQAKTCPAFNLDHPASRKDSLYPGALGAWIAEMDFPVAPPITNAISGSVDASLLAYADTVQREQIKAATVFWLEQRFNWNVQISDVFYVADILAGYEAVIRTLISADAKIVVPTPAYGPLLTTPKFFDRKVIKVPCKLDDSGRYILDYEAIDKILTPGTLFVLTNPYNPVGQSYRRDELEKLAAVIAKNDALVFSDEVHSPLILNQGIQHIPYASINEIAASHSVIAISASKAFNVTGLKTAQLIIPSKELNAKFKKYAAFYADGASRLGLSANVAAYTDPESYQWLDQTLETLRQNFQTLQLHFALHHPDVIVAKTEATYLAWLDVRSLDLGQNPTDFLLKYAGVAVSDGSNYASPGFIRINFALEPETLQRALQQISRAVRARQAVKRSLRSLRALNQAQILEVVGL